MAAKSTKRTLESTGFQIGRVHRAFVNRLNHRFQQEGYNITMEQWSVLIQINEKDGLSQQELTEKLDRDKTTVTRLLDGVVNRNLVKRANDDTDRRQKRLHMSEPGRKLVSQLIPLAEATLKEAEKGISKKDLQAMHGTLEKLFQNLSRNE